MAAQVLSGSGNVSYTNSTGQNVRLVINYLEIGGTPTNTATFTFAGVSVSLAGDRTFGKTLAYRTNSGDASMTYINPSSAVETNSGVPLEIAMANGDTFSITSDGSADINGYNIIIVPEAG